MKKLLLLLPILLIGCEPNYTSSVEPKDNTGMYNRSERFFVSRVQVFRDDLSYNSKRGVYIIQDSKTGKEYIGVSGVGINELTAHAQTTSNGKNTTTYMVEHEQ